MKHATTTLAASVVLILGALQPVQAHTVFVMDVTRVPVAGKGYNATLTGHGCEVAVEGTTTKRNYDTEVLEVVIPAGVTGVQPMDATWGKATVVKDEVGNVTKILWTNTGVNDEDSNLYQATFRATLPDAPMTSLAFDITHVCNQGASKSEWIGANAAKLYLQPARKPGWNKYTAQVAIDVAAFPNFFADAQIVWSNGAAYSVNAETTKLITNALTTIPMGQEFWVKY